MFRRSFVGVLCPGRTRGVGHPGINLCIEINVCVCARARVYICTHTYTYTQKYMHTCIHTWKYHPESLCVL